MSTLPVTPVVSNPQIGDSQKAPYLFTIFDKDGQPIQPLPDDPPITVVASSPSITIVPDAVPIAPAAASGFAVGGAPVPTLGVTITANYTPGPTATAAGAVPVVQVDTVDVVPGAATTGTFTLGPPVSQ